MPTDTPTTATALPRIGWIAFEHTDGRPTAPCWCDSTQLRYRERVDGVVVKEVCRADHPKTVVDTTEIGHPDDYADISVYACLVDSLDVYHE